MAPHAQCELLGPPQFPLSPPSQRSAATLIPRMRRPPFHPGRPVLLLCLCRGCFERGDAIIASRPSQHMVVWPLGVHAKWTPGDTLSAVSGLMAGCAASEAPQCPVRLRCAPRPEMPHFETAVAPLRAGFEHLDRRPDPSHSQLSRFGRLDSNVYRALQPQGSQPCGRSLNLPAPYVAWAASCQLCDGIHHLIRCRGLV